MSERRVAVFAGPSLRTSSRAVIDREPMLDLHPPARRGDVLRAIARGATSIVLLDGYYYDVLAVGHKELLLALDEGINVIGASSMGALRAIELQAFGMVGVGRIFDLYRDGVLDGDDEVAILHAPKEQGYRATSIALVEVRFALDHHSVRTAPVQGSKQAFLAAVKALGFVERLPDRIRALGLEHLGPIVTEALLERLASSSQKEIDGKRAIAAALRSERQRLDRKCVPHRVSGLSSRPSLRFRHTEFLCWDLERFLRLHSCDDASPPLRRVFDAVALLHPGMPEFLISEHRRFLLSTAATHSTISMCASRTEEVEHLLTEHLRAVSLWGVLPASEIRAEAQCQAAAEAALDQLGESRALRLGAEILGLDHELRADRDAFAVPRASDLARQWQRLRALLFTEAAREAVAVTGSIDEIHHCFLAWAQSSRVTRRAIERIACEILDCSAANLATVSLRRGLALAESLGPNLADAIQWLAPVHRLPQPLNSYPRLRDHLRTASLAPCSSRSKASPTRSHPGSVDATSPCEIVQNARSEV